MQVFWPHTSSSPDVSSLSFSSLAFSSPGQFITTDGSPHGFFTSRSFPLRDNSSHGTFTSGLFLPRTFLPLDIYPLGRFHSTEIFSKVLNIFQGIILEPSWGIVLEWKNPREERSLGGNVQEGNYPREQTSIERNEPRDETSWRGKIQRKTFWVVVYQRTILSINQYYRRWLIDGLFDGWLKQALWYPFFLNKIENFPSSWPRCHSWAWKVDCMLSTDPLQLQNVLPGAPRAQDCNSREPNLLGKLIQDPTLSVVLLNRSAKSGSRELLSWGPGPPGETFLATEMGRSLTDLTSKTKNDPGGFHGVKVPIA